MWYFKGESTHAQGESKHAQGELLGRKRERERRVFTNFLHGGRWNKVQQEVIFYYIETF
jgi:hypothetical protein